MALNWGIASAGNISNDFAINLRCMPKENHRILAIGAKDLGRAKAFADKHGVERAYGSYEELAKDPDVAVVYVGAINPLHFPITKLMLENGKHVLCEKPFTINLKQTEELVALAKHKNVFLLHGIWSRFFPVYKKLSEALQSKVIGDVKYVYCTFGNAMKRVIKLENGCGGLFDIGVYAVQFVLMAFGGSQPSKISAVGHLRNDGVDNSICASMKFPCGGVANIASSIEVKYPCEGIIYGTKGTIKVHYPFWCPTKITINDELFEFHLPTNTTEDSPKCRNSTGMQYQAEEVKRCIDEGLTESPFMKNSETELIMYIMDSIRSQIGLVYDTDKS